MYAGAVVFVAAALASEGPLRGALEWVFAGLFGVLIVAGLLRLMFPRSLVRWLRDNP